MKFDRPDKLVKVLIKFIDKSIVHDLVETLWPTKQVQSNWSQSDSQQVDFIKNKPTLPSAQIQSDWTQADTAAVDYIKNKPTIPAAQIQSDYAQTNSSAVDFIKNKPTSFPTLKIGGATDYVEFGTDGTLKMYGNATIFDDVTFDAIAIKNTGVGISINTAENCAEYLASADENDYMIINCQFPHSRKLGAPVFPHIHWSQNQNAVPNFAFQYRWQVNGGAKTTAWTAIKCNIPAFTYVSGTLNQIVKVATGGITPPAGDNISDILQLRVIRDTDNALGLAYGVDPYTGVVQVIQTDIHIEKNDLGSKEEYVK